MIETLLNEIARYVALAIQAIAVLVVAIGTLRAVLDMTRVALASGGREEQRKVWVHYARWLVAGLTFQLAADVVGTSFSPTWDEVGKLAAVAGIRTVMSFFLDREMEDVGRLRQASAPRAMPADDSRVASRREGAR
jgi:uncharacterized membrane protein